jgi:putative membrane protein
MRRLILAHVALVATLAERPALAHESETLAAWTFEPWVVLCLLACAALYARGVARLWRSAGPGRGASLWQATAFAAGWLVLGIALCSPLDELATQLFSAHMVQHELLMAVAAPLLVLGRPLGAWAWALPQSAVRQLGAGFRAPGWRHSWRWLSAPGSSWALHALAIWAWHLPAWFEAALHDTTVHILQHVSFLGTALLFWWSVLRPRMRAGQGVALISVFTTMMHTAALGALLTMSSRAWYPAYGDSTLLFGLSALEDQQLGGLVMWLPSGLVYFAAGLVLVARWGALVASREAGRPEDSTHPLMDSPRNRRLSSATKR